MNRLILYFFFDEAGIVDDYIVFMLKELKKKSSKILFVVNGFIVEDSKNKIVQYVDDILVRKNFGYDVWAYKEGIEYLKYEELKKYDEFVMMNYTNFGPIYPFDEMFDKMDQESIDFWGLSMSWGNGDNIPVHIQSHFIAVRNKILKSTSFEEYWANIPEITCFNDALFKHEFVFTKYFEERGFSWNVYLNIEEYKNDVANPLLVMPYEMLKNKRTPLIKRKSFFMDPEWLFETGLKHNIIKSLEYISENTNYPVEFIWKNMLRTQDLHRLRWTMGLDIVANTQNIKTRADVLLFIDNQCQLEKYTDIITKLDSNNIYVIKSNKENFTSEYKIIQKTKDEIIDIIPVLNETILIIENINRQSNLTDAFLKYDKENIDNIIASMSLLNNKDSEFTNRKEIGAAFSSVLYNKNELDSIWQNDFKKINTFFMDNNLTVKMNKKRPPVYVGNGCLFLRTCFLKKYLEIDDYLLKYNINRKLKWILLVLILQVNGFASAYVLNDGYITDQLSFFDYEMRKKTIKELRPFTLKEMLQLNFKYLQEKKYQISNIIQNFIGSMKLIIYEVKIFFPYTVSFIRHPKRYNCINSDSHYRIAYFNGCEDNRSDRYRIFNLIEGLNNNGFDVDVYTYRSLKHIYKENYNLFVIFRENRYRLLEWEKHLDWLKKNGTSIVYDTDDNLLIKTEARECQNIMKIAGKADCITVTTKHLSNVFSEKIGKPVYIIRETINSSQLKLVQEFKPLKNAKKVKIAYQSGFPAHDRDFEQLGNSLITILKKYPFVEFHLFGPLNLNDRYKTVKNQIITHKYMNYLKLQKEVSVMDINLAPLVINEFNQCKSETKIFEAALLGIPTICSPIDAYADIIDNWNNGILAKDEKDWYESLEKLILDKELRKRIGNNAQCTIVKEFKLSNEIRNVIDIYGKIINCK